jgi:hypothetical protein
LIGLKIFSEENNMKYTIFLYLVFLVVLTNFSLATACENDTCETNYKIEPFIVRDIDEVIPCNLQIQFTLAYEGNSEINSRYSLGDLNPNYENGIWNDNNGYIPANKPLIVTVDNSQQAVNEQTLLVKYDGGKEKKVFLPPLLGGAQNNWVSFFVDINGSSYYACEWDGKRCSSFLSSIEGLTQEHLARTADNSDKSCEDKCIKNSDCDDNDISTADLCSGKPKRCSNKKINRCLSGDDYCPLGCKFEQDNDCIKEDLDKCKFDSDCNDNNISTEDTCHGSPKQCSNIRIVECISGDGYCPINCKYDIDKDCQIPDECNSNADCEDKNPCTTDRCIGVPKKCYNDLSPNGCVLNNSCVPISTRTEKKFCDIDNTFKDQKLKEVSCNNNYECASNICINSKCIEPNFIQKILNWLKKLFE